MASDHLPDSTVSADRKFFDDEIDYFAPENLAHFLKYVEDVKSFFAPAIPHLKKLSSARGALSVIELGAGTCLMSLQTKNAVSVESIVCTDISMFRMQALAQRCAELLHQDLQKMSFATVDFTVEIPFPDASFDLVCFDASLHHSRNIWRTLSECRRVLRRGGLLIAQREQYLATLTHRYALSRLLRTNEVRSGVSENAFLRAQYEYFLRAGGFEPHFLPVTPLLRWKLLAPLNGVLFSKWTIVAERSEMVPAIP